jgi:hypothetical protein
MKYVMSWGRPFIQPQFTSLHLTSIHFTSLHFTSLPFRWSPRSLRLIYHFPNPFLTRWDIFSNVLGYRRNGSREFCYLEVRQFVCGITVTCTQRRNYRLFRRMSPPESVKITLQSNDNAIRYCGSAGNSSGNGKQSAPSVDLAPSEFRLFGPAEGTSGGGVRRS